MNKKNIVIILLVIVITIAIVTLYGTFASSNTVNNSGDTSYNITITGSTEDIVVPANSSKTVIYQITNTNKGKVQYGIAYSGTNITVRIYIDSEDQASGLIDYGENKFVKLYISNNGTTESTATIKTILGYENGGDLIIPSGYTLVTEIYPTPMPLREYITNLYNNASKTIVTNNSIEYNYATSVSLMNDRLGGTTADYDAGNIRYYGADPNNYIDIGDVYEKDIIINNWEKFGDPFTESSECYAYFDCSTNYAEFGFEDEASCIASLEDICGTTTIPKGTPILYRIIGLFKDVELADGTKQDLVKVVRNDSIGDYSWNSLEDSSTSTSSLSNSSNSIVNLLVSDGKYKSQFLAAQIKDGSINDWNVSSLMKLLNPGYESKTVGGSLWWNSGSGTCYSGKNNATTSCDFNATGLSSNAQNKIASVVWNLGGCRSESMYSDPIYSYERGTEVDSGRPTEWTGKVALAYPSDYGYAADFNSCAFQLVSYDNSTCTSVNWMKMMFGSNDMWLLTPDSSSTYDAWYVESSGHVVSNSDVGLANGVRPALYLNSVVGIVSGDGTEAKPYLVR